MKEEELLEILSTVRRWIDGFGGIENGTSGRERIGYDPLCMCSYVCVCVVIVASLNLPSD